MNANELWSSIGDLHVWGVVLVTGLAGAAGGLVHAASQNPAGLTDVPGAPPLKKWKQMLVGALAAVAVLYYAAPKPGIEWIAAALLGGYAGDAVMAALAARFTAALAQRTAEQANVRAETLRQIAEDRRAAATELIGMVEQLRPSQAAEPKVVDLNAAEFKIAEARTFEAPRAFDASRFDELKVNLRRSVDLEAVAAAAATSAKTIVFEITWSGIDKASLDLIRDNFKHPKLLSRREEPGRIAVTWEADPGRTHRIDWDLVAAGKTLTELKAVASWEGSGAPKMTKTAPSSENRWADHGSLGGDL